MLVFFTVCLLFRFNQPKADWQVTRDKMFKTFALKNWILLCPDRARNVVQQFLQCLSNVARNLDFEIRTPEL